MPNFLGSRQPHHDSSSSMCVGPTNSFMEKPVVMEPTKLYKNLSLFFLAISILWGLMLFAYVKMIYLTKYYKFFFVCKYYLYKYYIRSNLSTSEKKNIKYIQKIKPLLFI